MASDDCTIVTCPTSLDPLSSIPQLRTGLIAVTTFGFLSFVASVFLFFRLAWRLIQSSRKQPLTLGGTRINQFIILLTSLVFADMQQSCAFWLNGHWLATNAITISTPTCWAQGWFVSTGDLGSGLFTFAIALHAFADIVYDFRLGPRSFVLAIISLWAFNYLLPVIGIAMHPTNFYSRAGAWCWINDIYVNERLWLHYFWVIICEFGTVIVYALIFFILQKRVRSAFYKDTETAYRARSAAKVIVAYPIVYVVCTLPLVKARLTAMAGKPVSFVELCVAGAMITSNGWLDVLLYSLTRSSSIFAQDAQGAGDGILQTFRHRPDQAFGTTTIIEATRVRRSLSRKGHLGESELHSRSASTEELWASNAQLHGVKADTTVVVRTDTVELEPVRRNQSGEEQMSKETDSMASRSQKLRNFRR